MLSKINILLKTTEARIQWADVFKVLKDKNKQLRIIYSNNCPLEMKTK